MKILTSAQFFNTDFTMTVPMGNRKPVNAIPCLYGYSVPETYQLGRKLSIVESPLIKIANYVKQGMFVSPANTSQGSVVKIFRLIASLEGSIALGSEVKFSDPALGDSLTVTTDPEQTDSDMTMWRPEPVILVYENDISRITGFKENRMKRLSHGVHLEMTPHLLELLLNIHK